MRPIVTLTIIWACLLGMMSTGAVAAEYEIKLGTVAPDGTPWSDHLNRWKQRVEKESEGRIKVILYLGGVVGGEDEMVRKVRRGRALNAGGFSTNALSDAVAEFQLISLPFLFDSLEEADFILDGVLAQPLKEKLNEVDLQFVFWSDNGLKSFVNSERPIRTPKDLDGLRFRSQTNKSHIEMYRALGANPVPMSMPEVLPALQRGVIDGADNTPLLITAASWHTATKYYSLTRHLYEPAMIVINKRYLERMPQELQEIVLKDSAGEAAYGRKLVRELMPQFLDLIKESGVEVNEITPEARKQFQEKTRRVHQMVAEEIGAEKMLETIYQGKKDYAAKQAE